MGGNSVAMTTATTLSGSRFTGSGVVAVPLTVSRPSFLRVVVVLANNTIAAVSNPTWLFPTPPAGVTVPQGDVAAMAAAVPWALDLDRGRVREASVRRFGVAAMTDRYLALYDSLIGLREEESA